MTIRLFKFLDPLKFAVCTQKKKKNPTNSHQGMKLFKRWCSVSLDSGERGQYSGSLNLRIIMGEHMPA